MSGFGHFFSCCLPPYERTSVNNDRRKNTSAAISLRSAAPPRFLSLGRDVNDVDRGETPLNSAVRHGHTEWVNTLIENGADLNIKRHDLAPIFWAFVDGKLEILETLIQKGANVNATDGRGMTLLFWASEKGKTKIAQLLIAHGANVNATDAYGETPLHLASHNEKTKMTQLLIANGADVNNEDYIGNTPLHSASDCGNIEITKLLIKHGANVNAKNLKGDTPLHLALKTGHLEIVKIFIQKGADVNATDAYGETPLHLALNNRHTEIAKLLKIVNHLDENDSIDTLNYNIENITPDEIKGYYNENKEQIDSLIDKRTKTLIKKAIIDLNEDISIATIKRGKSFLADQLKIRSLQELCAITLQKYVILDEYTEILQDYPKLTTNYIYKDHPPLLTQDQKKFVLRLLQKREPSIKIQALVRGVLERNIQRQKNRAATTSN